MGENIEDIERFQIGMDGDMEPSPNGDWVYVSDMRAERAAHQHTKQRLADLQATLTTYGLAHQKAVQQAVSEAVTAELEECENRVVTLYETLATPYLPDITRAIRARGVRDLGG